MMNDGDVVTKVWMLLDIIHKAASAGPAFAKWAKMAQDELDRTESFLSEAPAEQEELPLNPQEVEPPHDE